ncbi:hypothetical protein F5Y14DRAFT_427060 [Nemania sp. NC0429]|nr:hypothetical protein F5Y14DRAFT_427060 [Nemania sp. NC0429]
MTPTDRGSGSSKIAALFEKLLFSAEDNLYMEERGARIGLMIPQYGDFHYLPQTESYMSRLRDRIRGRSNVAVSPDGSEIVAPSTIDMDKVNDRLLEVSDESIYTEGSLVYSAVSSPDQPDTPEDVSERMFYESLVEDGGRPLYPIHLLDDVARDPGAHQDMLRPWLLRHNAEPPEWEVFRAQSVAWKHFRRWQLYNRHEGPLIGMDKNNDETYQHFVHRFRRDTSSYTKATKQLLAKYNFDGEFQLHHDRTEQDKLTTWIEYLAFMCAFDDLCTLRIERSRGIYNESWRTLLETKVLRPHETREYVHETESAALRDGERARAYEAVKSAEAMLSTVQQLASELLGDESESEDDLDRAREALEMQTAVAQYNLATAKEWLTSIERRDRLVTAFRRVSRAYLGSKRDKEIHSSRLQWAFDQFPLVRAEMGEPAVPEIRPSERGTKRGRDQENADTQDRGAKRQRGNTPQAQSSLDRDVRSASQPTDSKRTAPKRTRGNTANDTPAPEPSIDGSLAPLSHTNSPHRDRRHLARSVTSKAGKPDGENTKVVVELKAGPASKKATKPKATKPVNDPPLRKTNTKKAAQSSTVPAAKKAKKSVSDGPLPKANTRANTTKAAQSSTVQPAPRRSARIAANAGNQTQSREDSHCPAPRKANRT